MPAACPTIAKLEAYLHSGSAGDVDAHVNACSECRRRVDEIRENDQFLTEFNGQASRLHATFESARPAPEFPTPPAGYTIQRVLGRGGQAVVYEAIQESTRRRVAVKVLRLGVRDASRKLRRFDREIELVSNLRHPLIVTVFDRGVTTDGEPYQVLEYVDGAPIARRAGATARDTLTQFQRVCEAIQYAHQHGVVHRDIKPSNILVDEHGLPRVLDFGLATSLEPSASLALTQSREFLGTPIYAAPELLRSGAMCTDVRTDVYGLGVVLYELLTGAHPFSACAGLADLVTTILEGKAAPPSSHAPGLDNEVDTIVLKAIEKEPDRRYQTVEALGADIGRYLRGEPIAAKRDSTWYTLRKVARRHRWAVASGAGLLVLLVAFSVVMSVLYRRASDTSRQLARALATRDLDRGIELARSDNLMAAEPLLWGEYLKWLDDGASVEDRNRGPLLKRRAYWGLCVLYQRQPCVATAKLGEERMRLLVVESPESILATSPRAKVVRWNPATGEQKTLFVPAGVDGPLDSVQARVDIDRVVVVRGSVAYCWELKTGRLLRQWPLPDAESITGWGNLARTTWGVAMGLGHADGTIRIWDVDASTVRNTIETELVTPSAILLEDEGRMWAAGGFDEPFAVHDFVTGTTTTSRELTWAGHLAIAPDGRILHTWKIWSGADEQLITALEETAITRGNGWIFSASGTFVVGKGTTTPIWRADTGRLVRVLASHDATVCALGPDDRTLATAHADGTVRAWDIAPTLGRREYPVSDTAHCVRFDDQGRRLVIAGSGPQEEPFLQIVDAAGAAAPLTLDQRVHKTTISSASFLPGSELLATGDHDGVLATWKADGRGLVLLERTTLPGGVNALATSPNRDWIAAAGDDGLIWMWRPEDGSLHSLGGHGTRVSSLAFSRDGSRLVTGSSDMKIFLWDAERGVVLRELGEHNGPVRAVRFSAEDEIIATAGDDQVIQLWDAREGKLLRRLPGHGVRVFALAFSPDNLLLASGDASGGVKLWDVQSGAELASLPAHGDMVFSLDFSPDGATLASGSKDGSVRLWDLHYFDSFLDGNRNYQRDKLQAVDSR